MIPLSFHMYAFLTQTYGNGIEYLNIYFLPFHSSCNNCTLIFPGAYIFFFFFKNRFVDKYDVQYSAFTVVVLSIAFIKNEYRRPSISMFGYCCNIIIYNQLYIHRSVHVSSTYR